MEEDPEVIEVMNFLRDVQDDTLINVDKILEKLASYAYKPHKDYDDYNDMFALIGLAHGKVKNLLELNSSQ